MRSRRSSSIEASKLKDGYSIVFFTFATTSASYSQGKLQENYGGSLPFNKFIRELSQGRWRRQRESEKRNRFIKNNNFARVAHFFVHFFAVTARLRLLQDTNERRRIFLSLSKLECGPQEVNSAEICLRLTFSAKWKKKITKK